MDSDMSDGTPVSPRLDARMLADLRAWRARQDTAPRHLTVTIDELDMFLRVADERDALRRELVGVPDDHFAPVPVRSVPFSAEIPDEIRERAAEKREPAHWTACTRCNGRGGLPYEGPCSDCLGTGSTPA